MTIHSIWEIGSVLRNAVVFNFKNRPEVMMNADMLSYQVWQLFNLLDSRKAEYVLVGGIALLTYIEGRNTQDIDFIMNLPSLARLPEIWIESQDMHFAQGRYVDLRIDILLTKNPLFDRVAKKHSVRKQLLNQEIQCATIEGLILLKLYFLPSLYRQGSFERVGVYENDIATLIYRFSPNLGPLLKELNKHLNAADMAEVRRAISDIEERIQRFKKTKK